MKLSIQFLLFFLLGLVASLPLPPANQRQSPKQYTLVDSGKAVGADPSGYFRQFIVIDSRQACYSILTSCRTAADCCSGLRCGTFDDDMLCVPAG